jgi:2-(1,2-epoxy-1,2-dihydrophenyl)acetyl-CoA isomerase
MSTDILVRRTNGVVEVRLNRPERKNAMLPQMWSELAQIIGDIERNDSDRVLLLGGEGDAFCSGADISARWSPDVSPNTSVTADEILANVKRCVLAMAGLSKPSVAVVDGIAAGGGCNLALSCDLVVASSRARFSQIFVRRGLTVDTGGSWILPRLVGAARARRLVLLGEVIDAELAYELGLVTHLVAETELDAQVAAIIDKLLEHSAATLAEDKKLLVAAEGLTLAEALDRETRSQLEMMKLPHVAAAMREFLARSGGI